VTHWRVVMAQPADQRGIAVGERQQIGAEEARAADEVKRLVDLAVMIVAIDRSSAALSVRSRPPGAFLAMEGAEAGRRGARVAGGRCAGCANRRCTFGIWHFQQAAWLAQTGPGRDDRAHRLPTYSAGVTVKDGCAGARHCARSNLRA